MGLSGLHPVLEAPDPAKQSGDSRSFPQEARQSGHQVPKMSGSHSTFFCSHFYEYYLQRGVLCPQRVQNRGGLSAPTSPSMAQPFGPASLQNLSSQFTSLLRSPLCSVVHGALAASRPLHSNTADQGLVKGGEVAPEFRFPTIHLKVRHL